MFREGLERTPKELAASAPSAMKINVVAPPDLDAVTLPLRGSVVPAARRLINSCTPTPHVRSPSFLLGHVLDALVEESPCPPP